MLQAEPTSLDNLILCSLLSVIFASLGSIQCYLRMQVPRVQYIPVCSWTDTRRFDHLVFTRCVGIHGTFYLAYRESFILAHEGSCSKNVFFPLAWSLLVTKHVLLRGFFCLFLASLFAICCTLALQRNCAAFIRGKKIASLIFQKSLQSKALKGTLVGGGGGEGVSR